MTTGATRAALGTAWWTGGLNLSERRAGLRPGPSPAPAGAATRWRLRQWRDTHGLEERGLFERRLEDAGLTVERLIGLLEEEPAALAGRHPAPAWAGQVADVIASMREEAAEDGFGPILAPFARIALSRLAAGLGELAGMVHAGSLLEEWAGRLRRNLTTLASRTLVLELNVMRVGRRLAGSTPQERFADFVRRFQRPEAVAALCEEYPVLARLLVEEASRFADVRLEMLERFARDRAEIVRALLGGADPGALVKAAVGGDTHQSGRSVAVLSFAGGARVVYKPRPQAVHRHFNAALAWLNDRVAGLDLIRLTVVDRGRYGWVEFAPHLPCQDQEAVDRYYHRLGALLALIHALDGADFHCENLIARGDQPVLVDLEALLHPIVPTAEHERLLDDPAERALEASVSRSALLPQLIVGENGVADLSGMGGDKGAPMPMRSPAWAGQGTDEMRLIRDQMTFPGGRNRPYVGGSEAQTEPADHIESFLSGFGRAYDAIVADAGDLTALLRRFAGDEVRVVLRPTRIYGTLLTESTHPDVLRHGLDRDRVLDYLWAISGGDPARQRVVRYEIEDLWAGDIPIFTTRPDSTDLWTSGGVRIPGLLREPGLTRATRKIMSLGDADRARQEWVIRASMVSRDRSGLAALVQEAPSGPSGGTPPDPARLVAAARDIADLIARDACDDGKRVNWLGLELVDEKHWTPRPLGPDLYGGYIGVALFLARLAVVTGAERYADLARRALTPVPRLAGNADGRPVMGAFTGLAGVAYGLLHLAVLLEEPALAEPVAAFAELSAKAAEQDDTLDVIGGSAGTLAVMLAVHRATGLAAAWRAAEVCAERLLTTAAPTGAGVAWRTTVAADRPLTGFSHGAAGIGWALLRFASAGGDRRAAEVALAAFAYEHEQYRPRERGWPDHRQGPASGSVSHAWCHGAPGIGLSRISGPELAEGSAAGRRGGQPPGDVHPRADLELALQAELARRPMANHSLCHGELGNLELLIRLRERPEAAQALEARTAHILDDLARRGPRCGVPGDAAGPGLLNGLAGIGYGLLRLADPGRVPSVLLLDAPAGKVR
ncbi:type 2 lanthipeptide synthetase LanM family protein [Sphaerisporangium fuscum]|uniref:type 2 lanthipeptide synthetase LanM family protein n=1 Tax=Sphaerisporangium fuscum TaxID=2835868 RepID=UPI001BDC82B3|nr:type 2 lanthipeptide synthetase LanM family protein [Sphaerisporangium fuscum]